MFLRNDVSAAVTFAHQVNGGGRTVTLLITTNGKFSVANLPSDQANVSVTRVNSGQKSKGAGTVNVVPETTKQVRIFLKSVQ